MIRKFKCGLCNKKDRYAMARHELRKHLREEHRIRLELANSEYDAKGIKTKIRKKWWRVEDWED